MKDCQIKITRKKDFDLFISKLVKDLSFPFCICLIGDLGAGKTYFSKSLIKKLCGSQVLVNSPTFSLVNIYEGINSKNKLPFEIWHLDLYRITNEEEILELGLEEALLNSGVIIEWANRLSNLYPKNALTIELTLHLDNTRTLKLINS